MQNKSFLLVLLVPAFLLLVPLAAMQFTDEVTWSPFDFLVAWVLMAGVGAAYKLVTRRADNLTYRLAAGVALASAFAIVWGNLAVGFIGDEGNPANLLYAGVLAIGIIGAGLARFQPRGMARTLFATALAQALVPAIAVLVWKYELTPERWYESGLSTVFALLFVGSAFLFRQAAHQPGGPAVARTA